jgi:uncharacterized protein (TIGR03067 family)
VIVSCAIGGSALVLGAAVGPGSDGAAVDGGPPPAERVSGAGGKGATKTAKLPPAPKKAVEQPPAAKGARDDPPQPGGDAPITRARFTRAWLSGKEHTWYFRGKQFILVAAKGELPAVLVRAMLGRDAKVVRLRGRWDLDTDKGQLVLSAVAADGKPGPKEVRLGISPAGRLCVHIEKAGPYDIISFEDRLPVLGPGEFAPIDNGASRIDLEFLQGAWDLRHAEADGQALPAAALQGSRVLVKGKAITLISQGATSRGTFQLDAVPTPRTLDVTFTEGPEQGKKYLGIYELQEDTWRFCRAPAAKGRPTAFAGKAGSGHLLETLERAGEDAAGPAPKGQATAPGTGALKVEQSWEGIIGDMKRLQEAPPSGKPLQGAAGFVTSRPAWVKLWQAWRGGAPVPEVDFTKNLVLVFTLGGPNQIAPPELRLDGRGELTAHAVATLRPGEGFCYKIVTVRRQGIRSINGTALPGE